jgi:hypothetical protein
MMSDAVPRAASAVPQPAKAGALGRRLAFEEAYPHVTWTATSGHHRYRSPRSRRYAARRRKRTALDAAFRAWQEQQLPLWAREQAAREAAAARLAADFGVHARPALLRGGHGVEATGDGWLLLGPLDEVRAELAARL